MWAKTRVKLLVGSQLHLHTWAGEQGQVTWGEPCKDKSSVTKVSHISSSPSCPLPGRAVGGRVHKLVLIPGSGMGQERKNLVLQRWQREAL